VHPPVTGEDGSETCHAQATDAHGPRDRFVAQLLALRSGGSGSTDTKFGATQGTDLQSAVAEAEADCDDWEADCDEQRTATPPVQPPAATNGPFTRWPAPPDIAELRRQAERRLLSPAVRSLAAVRAALPAKAAEAVLVEAVCAHSVVLVTGGTGCGKSTQVPQYILDDWLRRAVPEDADLHLVCTQPRRVAAISVAERVAEERGEVCGAAGCLVGYHVRLDPCRSSCTRILFCTTGILLRKLVERGGSFEDLTHVIVDEVHERDLNTDLLLLLLKRALLRGDKLKVILMSATGEEACLLDYFRDFDPATVCVEGRCFDVAMFGLEDALALTAYTLDSESAYAHKRRPAPASAGAPARLSQHGGGSSTVYASTAAEFEAGGESSIVTNPWYDAELYQALPERTKAVLRRLNEERLNADLLEALLEALHASEAKAEAEADLPTGAFLVFLPGIGEIRELMGRLSSLRSFAESTELIPLHSSLTPEEQKRVFARPQRCRRKIVLATNIAETSITIEDVTCVVDSALVREQRHDTSRNTRILADAFASLAALRQRAGRAGRVRAGKCYTLVSEARRRALPGHPTPEMLRAPLETLCLQVAKLGLREPISDILRRAISAPRASAVGAAVTRLQALKAMNADETLTPLGDHLAALPVDVPVGKMLLYGAMFGCFHQVATIAAAVSYRSPFLSSVDARAQVDAAKRQLSIVTDADTNDLTAIVNAYDGWAEALRCGGARAGHEFCRRHMLSPQVLTAISDMRRQFDRLLVTAGFLRSVGEYERQPCRPHPSLLRAVVTAGLYPNVVRIVTDVCGRKRLLIADEEVHAHPSSVFNPGRFSWGTYIDKMRTSRLFVHELMGTSAIAIVLFGSELKIDHLNSTVRVDEWISMRCAPRTAVLLQAVRTMVEELLRRKLSNPSLAVSEAGETLHKLLACLLDSDRSANSDH
jgi:HrpA-like RNA helicase